MSNPTDDRPSEGLVATTAQPRSGDTKNLATASQITGAAGGDMSLREASLWSDAWRQLRKNPFFVVSALLILVLVIIAIAPGLFTDVDPRKGCSLSKSRVRPSAEHWFGYDFQGCDYFARVLYGTRNSMMVGLLTVIGTVVLGCGLGMIAGFYGGWLDSIIARLTDVIFGIPTVLGAIVVLNLFRERKAWTVALVLVLFGWPTTLRLMRSSVLSIKEMDYVAAARAMGASNARILRLHILPNALAPVIVYSTIALGGYIATEAALSFLGVGLQLPAISWGLMIDVAQPHIQNSPHLLLFPGAFLVVTVLSFILMGDALRDALDPKLR
ncbi:MAG: ABC transporter permease [Mycobacteriales bacterium]